MRTFLILSLMAVLAGCSVSDNDIVNPATVDEILEAAFVINESGGQGVFVGNVDEQGEHVYLLTAKHVAIYFSGLNGSLGLKVGTNVHWTVHAERSRWRRAAEMYDAAWFELSAKEREELRLKNGLKYIPLTCSPSTNKIGTILGTGYSEFEGFCKAERRKGVECLDVIWSRYGEPVHGRACTGKINFCKIEAKYNVPAGNYWVVGVRSGVIPEGGNSGGMVLVCHQIQGREYWLLAGLNIGGYFEMLENNCPYSLVTPMDAVAPMIIEGKGFEL